MGRVAMLALLAALVLSPAGCADDSRPAPPVQRVAEAAERGGVASVIVYVSDDGHEHVAVAGASPPSPRERFRIGSVTKTFTATIVLQLAAEGRLRLDDSLERHLPGFVPRGDEITIQELLQHRSGLPNYTDYASWMTRASLSRSLRPAQILRFAAAQPLLFPPGREWGYSNTNYIALGLVIEAVGGRTYAEELDRRILEPLELEQTELATSRRLPDLDDEGENPVLPWAAGAIVSTARDLSLFFSALLSGELLSDEWLAEMRRTVTTGPGQPEAGLGLISSATSCGRLWWHGGAILDYWTLVSATDDGDRVAVISAHGGFAPASPPDETSLLCPGAS